MKMQVPTCTNIRIRSTQDAHKIFYAVKQRLLHMVTRRLDADERSALRTGCVYTWEERGPHSELTGLGIERFTEGRRWSPSRVRDEFLFYYEKFVPPPESQQGSLSSGKMPPRDWDPLIKQTYSVWVETQKGKRKWHLTAYFTQATVDQLGTVDDIPGVRELFVPEAMFKSTRTSKNRHRPEEQARQADKPRLPSTVTRTYASFPGPVNTEPNLNHPIPAQQEASPSDSSYSDHLPYPLVYQARSQPSSSPSAIVPRTPEQEFYRYQPSVALPQSNFLFDTSQKQEQYSKATEEPSRERYSQRSPVASSSAKWLHDVLPIYPGTTYTRGLGDSDLSHGNDTQLHSTSGDYEHYSYPSSTGTSALTASGLGSPNYTLNLSDAVMSEGTYAHHPVSLPRSPPYAETQTQERNSYLPPLHSVEAIQASVYALANHGEILIPIEDRKSAVGPNRDLAPLHSLARPCPYRREPLDDRTLRLLRPRD